jgi:release factor glutamine methyltransferase
MNMKTVFSLIGAIQQSLYRVYDDPLLCNQYAWWIVERLTGVTKTQLLMQEAFSLDDAQEKKLQYWLTLLEQEAMPLSYLFGSVPFANINIIVKPPTLIPRPETEEWVVRLIEQLSLKHAVTILDLCCGSGCIGVALAKAMPQAHVYAIDDAPAALALTQLNAIHNEVRNITLVQSDLFDALPHGLCFDLIVSNPPYIAAQEWQHLETSVTAWEDRHALIADDNGYAVIKKIIERAPNFLQFNQELKKGGVGQLILEIDHQQADAVIRHMRTIGYNDCIVQKDLEGKDRVVSGRVDYVATTRSYQ